MSAAVPAVLYHYTCDHGHALIGEDDVVVPATHQSGEAIGTPGEYAWFTDLSVPIREALGLTSTILACDRTAHRYRVTDAAGIIPWTAVRRVYRWGLALELAPRARPAHWFVATEPVAVVYDPIPARAAS